MNDEDLQELQRLRLGQKRLREELEDLDRRLNALEARTAPPSPPREATLAPPVPEPAPAPLPVPAAKMSVPPPLPVKTSLPPEWHLPEEPEEKLLQPAPPPLPARPRESFELQLGAVWLARVGIVMLLTGLVFLGNYAWQTWGSHLGAAGRLAGLYLISGALIGTGARMYRRRTELRLYSQVLMGGGAALAYYCTYGAHFVARLRVIESPLLGGALLLGFGAGLLIVAERRRWQTAALLTVVLSYYTAGINPGGEFTLFSNLLLTAAGLVLLLRRQWEAITWVTLAGTYGSYAFWHLYRHSAGSGLRAEEPWLTGLVFLACYWAFFTAAVFLARAETFPTSRRVALLTLNNAAFVFFVVDHLLSVHPGALWAVCTAAGGVLLLLAAASWRWRREEPALDGAWLLQGVALFTAGLAQKLAGPQLSIVLALESLVLLTGTGRRYGWLWIAMASALAGWASGLGVLEFSHSPQVILPLGSTLSLLLLADAWWLKQRAGELSALRFNLRAAYFAAQGLLIAGAVIDHQTSPHWEPTAFSLAAVVCTASVYVLRLKEVVLGGQLYLVWAILLCAGGRPEGEPWWFIWPVAACALALAHWWQRQRFLPLAGLETRTLQFLSAAALVVFGCFWIEEHLTADPGMVAYSAAAVGTLVYGRLTGNRYIALCGQLFAAVAVVLFGKSFGNGDARWPAGLTPAAMALAGGFLFPAGRLRETLAFFYWWAGLGLLAIWAFRFVPEPWQALFFAGVFLVLLGAAAWRKHALSALGSAAFALLTFIAFWLATGSAPDWRSFAAILLVPAAARLARRFAAGATPEADTALHVISGLAAGSFWLWITRWCDWHGYERSLTVAWSGAAFLVLGAGLALRERVYRIGGFAILALAVGRIFLIDVWQLETLYRILSFLSLGAVLLLLGFLYSRYSEQIRRWL